MRSLRAGFSIFLLCGKRRCVCVCYFHPFSVKVPFSLPTNFVFPNKKLSEHILKIENPGQALIFAYRNCQKYNTFTFKRSIFPNCPFSLERRGSWAIFFLAGQIRVSHFYGKVEKEEKGSYSYQLVRLIVVGIGIFMTLITDQDFPIFLLCTPGRNSKTLRKFPFFFCLSGEFDVWPLGLINKHILALSLPHVPCAHAQYVYFPFLFLLVLYALFFLFPWLGWILGWGKGGGREEPPQPWEKNGRRKRLSTLNGLEAPQPPSSSSSSSWPPSW